MAVLSLIVLAYLLFAIESPLLASLGASLYAPDLLVPLLLAAASRLSLSALLVVALCAGLLLDGFTPLSPLGLHAELAVILAYAVRGFLVLVPVRSTAGRMVLGIGLSVVSDFILFVLLALFDRSFHSYGLIFARMVPHALLTGVAVPVVDSIVGLLWRWIQRNKDAIFYS